MHKNRYKISVVICGLLLMAVLEERCVQKMCTDGATATQCLYNRQTLSQWLSEAKADTFQFDDYVFF